MSFQNNMTKESYPYKIISSGYAPSSPHKVFKSCTTPVLAKQLFHTLVFSNFVNFHAIQSVSHGYSTIGGIEYGGCGEDKKKEIVSHQLGVSMGHGDAHQ